MLTAVYGSSEYAQAFSRIGSLFGNVYIVNTLVEIQKCNFEIDEETKKQKFVSIEYNYNATPVKAAKGILVGSDYQDWVIKQAAIATNPKQTISCVRMMLISQSPLDTDLSERIATFVYPPDSFTDQGISNKHPIRLFQLDSSISAAPRDLYLIMAIMQLDGALPAEQAKAPFMQFIRQKFPEVSDGIGKGVVESRIEAKLKAVQPSQVEETKEDPSNTEENKGEVGEEQKVE